MNTRSFFFTVLAFLFGFNFNFSFSQEPDEKLKNQDTNEEVVVKDVKNNEKSTSLLELKSGDNKFKLSFKNRTEGFYGRSTQLLSKSELDQVLYSQTTLDLKFSLALGKILRSDMVLRNKARWGNFTAINHVTDNEVKIKDALTGKHKHFLGRLFFWIREAWVEFSINDAFAMCLPNDHYLKFGAFPFKLGRGISLGEAYAVSPGLLGFYANNVIDQYAFGCLLHGSIIKKELDYDFYWAVLENQSDSFDNVNDKIFSRQVGRRDNPERGFGRINFVVASRLDWFLCPFKPYSNGILTLEPYILYNRNPEQKVDFPSDAVSQLATLGLYVDFEGDNWEWGFEFAKNFGHQFVKPWDRNKVVLDRNSDGFAVFNYNHVVTADPKTTVKPPKAIESNANKKIVDSSDQGANLNGQEIGDSGLYNSLTRFRKGYKNKYKGFMFVADAAYWFCDNFKWAATVGWATGDEDPNVDLHDANDTDIDENFEGFIGLQEIYTGKRVQSVFIIGPNRIPRPLSFPSNNVPEEDRFASNVTGFSNLIFVGTGVEYTTCACTKEFTIRPNLLAYWEDSKIRKFSKVLKSTLHEDFNGFASKYLGFEANVFVDVKLLNNLKGFFVGGIFVPGTHFKHIEGKPLNADQREILEKIKVIDVENNLLPILGRSPAWSLNWGFEFTF